MKLKRYFISLWDTFSSPSYYLKVLSLPFSFSLSFFLMSLVLLTILSSLIFRVLQLPHYQQLAQETVTQVSEQYPADLEIKWSGKELTVTPDAPLFIPYPQFFTKSKEKGNFPENLGLVDTHYETPQAALEHYNTGALFFVNGEKLFLQDNPAKWSETLLADLATSKQPFVINKENLPQYIKDVRYLIDYGTGYVTFAYPFFYFFTSLFRLGMSVFISSVLIFYGFRLANRRFPFPKVVQLCLHVVIVAETAQLFIKILFPYSDMPIFSIVFWLFMTTVLIYLRKIKFVPLSQKESQGSKR